VSTKYKMQNKIQKNIKGDSKKHNWARNRTKKTTAATNAIPYTQWYRMSQKQHKDSWIIRN